MDSPSILPILKRIPIFADLSEAEHEQIIKNIVLNYFPVGYVFFKEGDTGTGAYILKHGMVKISRTAPTYVGASGISPSGGDKEVAVLSDNDFFGEMSLVTEDPRNATATAVTECEVFQIRKEDFMALMQTSPTLANKISTEFTDRAKKNNTGV